MMKRKTFRAMGTDVEIIVHEVEGLMENRVEKAIESAQKRMFSLEALLTRFREDSEVSRINSGNGHWIPVSAETVSVLRLAERAFERTKGFFNPFIGQVLVNLGYTVTFEAIRDDRPPSFTVEAPYISPVRSPLLMDLQGHRVRLEPGYKIDLGGIAKGWIVEQASDVLTKYGFSNFICNAGGDLVCRGTNAGKPWVVGITDPFNTSNSTVSLDVNNLSVATSGTYRRKWTRDGREVHHLIDPFLGTPVETDVVSCTVIHESLVEAEVLAKVALLLGSTEGVEWLDNQSTQGWFIVKKNGEVEKSCNL